MRKSVAIAFAIFDGASWMALCPSVLPGERRNGDGRACPRSRNALTSRFRYHAVGKTGPTGAVAWAEHRPHQGKGPGGLDEQPGRMVRHMLPVQFGQSSFEIVVHQRDRQVGGSLDDANAELTQGGAEFRCTLHVDRLNAHATFLEILLRGLRRQAKARPIGGHGAGGRARCRDDIAAVDQPLESFVDLVGRKIPLQLANELSDSLFRPFPIADASAQ